MKKIILFACAVFAMASCQKELPTISPSEATLYVEDVLQLTVTGEDNPRWIIGMDKEYQADSLRFVKVTEGNVVQALRPGKCSVGFEHFGGQSFGQQVHFIFSKIEVLPLPTITPSVNVMNIGDTVALQVDGIENPQWVMEYPLGAPEEDIIALTDDYKVIALAAGEVHLGFRYESRSDVGATTRSAFTTIVIE